MSGEHNAIEKSMEENLIDLMAKKVMSTGVQASLKAELKASPSNAC
jgi:hypothetical protein